MDSGWMIPKSPIQNISSLWLMCVILSFVHVWLILLMDINNDSVLDTQDLFYLMLYIAMHGVGMDVSWSDVLKN